MPSQVVLKPVSEEVEPEFMAVLSAINSPEVPPVGNRQPDGQIETLGSGAGVVALAQAAVLVCAPMAAHQLY